LGRDGFGDARELDRSSHTAVAGEGFVVVAGMGVGSAMSSLCAVPVSSKRTTSVTTTTAPGGLLGRLINSGLKPFS
jgi:hypothetical protein